MDIDGEFLTTLRNAMLATAVKRPQYPWPGPPEGMEGKPSSSYMGEHACMRRAYLEILARLNPGSVEVLERGGDMQVPAQRGWALEETIRWWLRYAEVPDLTINLGHFEDAVIGPATRYFGHPDDYVEFVLADLAPHRVLLEYKHQRLMAYNNFIKMGVLATEPLYYAQAQSMLATDEVKSLGITECLFIIAAFDVSAVKGKITMGKRGSKAHPYQGELEPDFRCVPDCSGVNPVFYLELIPSMPTFQRGLLAWCRKLEQCVEEKKAPPRKYDVGKVWQCDYCDVRYACEETGPCREGCEHTFCASQTEEDAGPPIDQDGDIHD